jgi:hypothetical protein
VVDIKPELKVSTALAQCSLNYGKQLQKEQNSQVLRDGREGWE